ncbi:Squalestatin tetraketide synthase [Cladobotryum mycophilum]|uniref:Squalestatin tetraketide synthase n=1 Tax=Cladobotryum mycophilum TaxID=491253 RepID=A0ABR0SPE1_9HYPO
MKGSRDRLADGVDASARPIAVVGIACRFSGDASNEDGLWQLLSTGQTTWSENVKSRFNIDAFWHPHAQLAGSVNCRGFHMLEQDPAVFDNEFFGISGVEAKAIDPQQRLLLEVAYEAFENAGMATNRLEGSNTGVYCAASYLDYDEIQSRDPETSPLYRFTGTGLSMIANRISYVFDLRGPSMTIDTACSSTLVALHEACRALRSGDVEQVLVGGTNLILDPDKLTVISSMQFLSPDGRSYSFDSRANGYGRGEGVAAIILKPLDSAIRDGDSIRGIIRGSAVGASGRTPGITMPSPESQYDTIRRAYETARLDPRETYYVEAHGTGTTAGDGSEITAFSRAFCNERTEKLVVGSIKANIGHTEFASGLAGVIKVLLMLEKGTVVPNPTFASPHSSLELEIRGIRVPTESMQWPSDMVRRASVNASGYGGMNAHVIIEAAPEVNHLLGSAVGINGNMGEVSLSNGITNGTTSVSLGKSTEDTETITSDLCASAKARVFVWTHRRDDGLKAMASEWSRFLTVNGQELSLSDLAFTLNSRRTLFEKRTTTVASDIQGLLQGLGMIESGAQRSSSPSPGLKLCFVFTGQGAQWAGMGLGLIHRYPVFAQSMQMAEACLLRLGATWRLIEELSKPKYISRVNEAEIAQPCCTAIQIALVDLLSSWDVQPELVCGHSSGEISAAYSAGVLTASDALKVAYFRGKSIQYLKKMAPHLQGAMLAVGLSSIEVTKYLVPFEGGVSIACINSPSNVTLSGDATAIRQVSAVLEADKVFHRKLVVEVAYHSYHMAVAEQFYQSAIEGIKPGKIKDSIRMVSSVTVQDIQGPELDATYWTRNLLSPVRFSDALGKALRPKEGDSSTPKAIVAEIGPHAALKRPITQVLEALTLRQSVSYLSCLVRNQDAQTSILSFAGELFTRGLTIDLNQANSLDEDKAKVLTSLPAYIWNHQNVHWNESRRSEAHRFRAFPRNDLLGSMVVDSISSEPSWRNYIRLPQAPWLEGHCINGQVDFAEAGFIAMVIEALRQQYFASNGDWKKKTIHFKHFVIANRLSIPNDAFGIEVLTQFRPYSPSFAGENSGWQEFKILSMTRRNASIEHCRGQVCILEADRPLRLEPNGPTQQACASEGGDDVNAWTPLEVGKFYEQLSTSGLGYSSCFATLDQILARFGETRCSLVVPDVKASMPSEYQQPHLLHPTTLSGCFQACLPGMRLVKSLPTSHCVTAIGELFISTDIDLQPGETLSVMSRSNAQGSRHHTADLSVAQSGDDNHVIIQAKGVEFSVISTQNQSIQHNDEPLCHQINWMLDPFCSSTQSVLDYCKQGLTYRQQELRKHCEPYCHSLIRQTLSELSDNEQNSVSGYLKFLLDWMKSQDIPETEPLSLSLDEKVGAVGAPGEMLVRLRRHLRNILLGHAGSLSLLLEDDLLSRIYSEDDCLNRCHAQLANYMKLMQFKVPNLRVLEVGGGTGSLTMPLLEALYGEHRDYEATHGTYVFTDISPAFFSNFQAKAQRFEPFMEFRRLDIEQSPTEQGFEPGSFDIIVASNVIHATRDLETTLGNLRGLLKPGGQVAFVELTEPSLRWGILGGGLEGWWLGANEGRTSSPLLQTSQWHELFVKSGFSGVSLEMKDYDSVDEHEVSLMVSHAVVVTQACKKEVTIITGYDTAVANEVRDILLAKSPETDVCLRRLSEVTASNDIMVILLELSESLLMNPSENDWERIRDIVCTASSVLWVTRGGVLTCSEPQRALVTGLSRSLRMEDHDVNFVTLDLDIDTDGTSDARHVAMLYEKIFGSDKSPYLSFEWEFAVRRGEVVVPRLLSNNTVDSWVEDTLSKHHFRQQTMDVEPRRSLGLQVGSAGIFESLYWADHPNHSQPLKPAQIQVRLENISLNARDLMVTTGQLTDDSELLVEGTGTIIKVGGSLKGNTSFAIGDRVCVFNPTGLATISNLDTHQVGIVPESMNPETASAIPLAYSTALFCLRDTARLKTGESILIHSGAGAVGQAAITIAEFLGAREIFVTVGSQEKRQFISDKFSIPLDHIFSSRNLSFRDDILQLTSGRGLMLFSIPSLGRHFLSSGKLELQNLNKNITFSTIDISLVATERPEIFSELIQTSLSLVQDNRIDCIEPIVLKHASEMEEHFRTMQAGDYMGKLVLELNSSLPLKVKPLQPKVAPLRGDGSYLVVGGTGSLGRPIVRHLANLGAKRIITLSRSGGDNPNMPGLIEEMEVLGVDLINVAGNVCDRQSMEDLKALSQKMPIRGVIQGVMALEDTVLRSMTYSQWCDGIRPKAFGTLNLHSELGEDLDFFIMLSSAGTIVGTHGQSNYCAGNALQDAFACRQASLGRPGLSIDVGIVEGITTKDEKLLSFLTSQGLRPHTMEDLLAVLSFAIQNPIAASPSQAQIICGMSQTAHNAESEAIVKQRQDAKFSHILSKVAACITNELKHKEFNVQIALQTSKDPVTAIDATYTGLRQRLAQLLAISEDEIRPDLFLANYGVDSLIMVELRQWIARHLRSKVQMKELMSTLSIIQLCEIIAQRSQLVPGHVSSRLEE